MTESEAGDAARDWHSLSGDETLSVVQSSTDGIASPEADRRLESYGPNRIRQGQNRSPIAEFFAVLRVSPMGWTWIGAGFLAFLVVNLAAEAVIDRVVD